MAKYEQLSSDVRKELNDTRKELDEKISSKVSSSTFWGITSGFIMILTAAFGGTFVKLDKLNDYYISLERRITIIETQITERANQEDKK